MSRAVLRSVLLAVVVCVLTQPVLAASYASAKNGAWGSSSTWSPAGVPTAGDNVSISHAVTIDALTFVDAVTITAAGSLTLNDTLYVSGSTVVNGAFIGGTSAAIVSFSGNITVNAGGTLDFTTGWIIVGTGATSLSGTGVVNAFSLLVSYTNLAVSGVTLNILGTLKLEQATYSGTSPQYVPDTNLIYEQVTGSAGAEWSANAGVGDVLFVVLYSSTLTLPGTTADTFYAGDVNIDAASSLDLGSVNFVLNEMNGGVYVGGALTQGAGDIRFVANGSNFINDGTFTHGSGTLEFNTTGFQQLNGPVTVGKLRIVNVYLEGFDTWTIQDKLDMEGTAQTGGFSMLPPVYDSANLNYINCTGTVGGEWPNTNAPDQVTLTSSDVTLNGGPAAVAATSLQLTSSILTSQDASIAVTNAVTVGNGSALFLATGGSGSAGSVSLADGGVIRKDHMISVPGSLSYDLTGVTLGFASVPADVISVILHGGNVSNVGTRVGLQTGRWWEITSGDSTIPSSVSLPTGFLPGTPDPYVCYYLGTPGSWSCARDSYGAGAVIRSSSLAYGTYAVGDQQLGSVPVSVSGFTVE